MSTSIDNIYNNLSSSFAPVIASQSQIDQTTTWTYLAKAIGSGTISNASGSVQNVAYWSDGNVLTGSNVFLFNAAGVATLSGNLVLKGTTPKIGVNVAPTARIHVSGGTGEDLAIFRDGGNGVDLTIFSPVSSIIGLQGGGGDKLALYANNSGSNNVSNLLIDTGGFIGLNTNSPLYQFDLYTNTGNSTYAGRFYNDGNDHSRYGIIIRGGGADNTGQTDWVLCQSNNGTAQGVLENTAAGAFQVRDASDERIKRDIAPTKVKGIETIRKIQPIEHRWKSRPDNDHLIACGFSAQNCQEAFPDMVSPFKDGTLGVARTALIPVLVKAIHDLDDENKQLKDRVSTMEAALRKAGLL